MAKKTIKKEKLYIVTKGKYMQLDGATEKEVRDFASRLVDHVNWKKEVQTADFENVIDALETNGYTVTES